MRLELRGLTKQYDEGRIVLQPIDLCDEVRTLAIIGPSGGGKSTLLRIIGGLLPPSGGMLCVGGEPVIWQEKELARYRRRLGYVFQQGGLFRHLTAEENIVLPLVKVHGYAAAQARERAGQLLDRFGMRADAHKKPAALSGGQQQRVAIARAIAARPSLLLLDEPTSALDPEYTTEVLDLVSELKADGLDFIIVTHEMGFARHACDTAAFLCEGRLMEYGPSGKLFASPQTEQLSHFLGKLLEWNV